MKPNNLQQKKPNPVNNPGLRATNHSDSFTQRPLRNTLLACLYIAYVVSVSAGLLFLNALLCLTIYAAIPKPAGEQLATQLGQAFYFLAPILLLLVEWNLLDRLQRLFDRQG